MTENAIRSLDDYEAFLTETLAIWSPPRSLAFAAAVAEYWRPAYEAFCADEDWGDPASLRRILEAVWGHVQDRRLAPQDVERHIRQLQEITPHMDDFDAPEALIACAVLHDALRCCRDADDTIAHAVGAAVGVFEGLVGDWPVDPAAQSRQWQKSAVRKQLQVQRKLIEDIGAMTVFDAGTISALRDRIGQLSAKPRRRPKPKAPPGLTNQTAFEQYRRMVEADLKRQVARPEAAAGTFAFALNQLSYWMARYSRRLQTINGSYGRLADELGQQALVARNLALDARATGELAWGKAVRDALEMCLRNNSMMKTLDAASVETPHAYGPSLRRLWLEGRRLGLSDVDAWNHVRAWGVHRPSAWEAEDRRKKKGLAYATPELGERLARPLTWAVTADPEHQWSADVDGVRWRVRVNDFPDELLYSLIVGDVSAGNFHDWPETWQRSAPIPAPVFEQSREGLAY